MLWAPVAQTATTKTNEDNEINDETTLRSMVQSRQRRTIIFRPLLQYKEEEIIRKGHYKPSAAGQYGILIPIQAASNQIGVTAYGGSDYNNNQYDLRF